MKNNKGFTLIEVLIVVSIIGLLSAVTLVGLGSFRSAGRDARRVADLRQYQNGLELYYTKFGSYPTGFGSYPTGSSLTNLPDLTTAGIGVNSTPIDPVNGATGANAYKYKQCPTGGGYLLEATLDDAANNKGGVTGTVCGETNCGGVVYCTAF